MRIIVRKLIAEVRQMNRMSTRKAGGHMINVLDVTRAAGYAVKFIFDADHKTITGFTVNGRTYQLADFPDIQQEGGETR